MRPTVASPVRLARAARAAVLAVAVASVAPCPAPAGAPAEELALHLALSSRPHGTKPEREALSDLHYELAARLQAAGAGEVIRDAWPGGFFVLTLRAPDASRALAVAREVLAAHGGARPGSYAVIRRGKGAPEERVPLGARGGAAP